MLTHHLRSHPEFTSQGSEGQNPLRKTAYHLHADIFVCVLHFVGWSITGDFHQPTGDREDPPAGGWRDHHGPQGQRSERRQGPRLPRPLQGGSDPQDPQHSRAEEHLTSNMRFLLTLLPKIEFLHMFLNVSPSFWAISGILFKQILMNFFEVVEHYYLSI